MPIIPFKIEVGAVPGLEDGAVLAFNGPIDSHSLSAFETQMDALRRRHFRRFLLEMGEVRYINSGGLAYLINMVESVQAAGGAVVLINILPKVKVILETMGFTEFLRLYPSKSAAIRELKASVVPRSVPSAPPPPSAPRAGTIRRLFRKLFGPPEDRQL